MQSSVLFIEHHQELALCSLYLRGKSTEHGIKQQPLQGFCWDSLSRDGLSSVSGSNLGCLGHLRLAFFYACMLADPGPLINR